MKRATVREWVVLGPVGSDYISYDPPDFEPASRIVVSVQARTARDAVLTAYRTMDRRDRQELHDITRGAGRNPLAALKPLAEPDCLHVCETIPDGYPELGWSPQGCPRCNEFYAKSESICKAIDERYP